MQGTDPESIPLRDIHLPDPISWWPLASGWWISFLLIVMLILLVVYLIRRYRKHKLSAAYLAQQEIEKIRSDFSVNQDKKYLIKELSELIRRVSISIFRREDAAGLTGEDWLAFLDQYSENNEFKMGIGRVLIEAPYQDNPEFNDDVLLELVSSWISSVSKRKRAG